MKTKQHQRKVRLQGITTNLFVACANSNIGETKMKDREQIFDIVNGVLAKYGIEPISEEDVARAWDELNTPENELETRLSFNKVWQRICEQEAKPIEN